MSESALSDFGRFLRHDPILKGFLAVFAVLHAPYVFPILSPAQLSLYGGRVNLVLLPAAMAAVLIGLRRLRSSVEARFWRYIAYAWGLWWIAAALQILWPATWRAFGFDLAVDGFFALYYLAWLMAVGLTPHRASPSTLADRVRRLRSAGTLVLLLGLCVYFLLVPARLSGPSLDSWVPSLFLFVILDLMLFSRLATLAWRAETRRWRTLYTLLAVSQLMNSYLDLQEGLIYQGAFEWPWGPRVDFLWNLPFLVAVAAARIRHYDFADPPSDDLTEKELSEWHLGRRSPLVLSALLLPILHVAGYRFELLDASARGAREGVTVICLLLLLALVLLESNLLFRGLRRASSQRRELQELRVAQEVARRAETTRSRFLANVSHEIRTPMNGILGIADIVLDGSLSPENRRRMEMLRSSARGLLQIIDDILDFTKIDAGELTVERRRFCLPELLEQTVGLHQRAADLAGVNLRLETGDDLPEYVAGDPSRLRQVLTNLVANAVKFTPRGEVVVRVDARQAPTLRFEVRDSGIGIDLADQERLFEPFTQLDASRSRQYGGTGLGLAISRQIAHRLGGEIGVESRSGEGSLFWLTVPLEPTRAPSRHSHEFADEPLWEQRPRILLAEDNPINQMVAMHQLEDLGAEVVVVCDGYGVIEAVESGGPFDLIFMDCQMPGMDGYEATRRIRARERGTDRRIPIIAVTAHAFGDDRERCLDAGMDDYLPKPYARGDLVQLLRRRLSAEGLDDSWSGIRPRR